MKGVFPQVTQADEKVLREAGWLPVLRWVRITRSGALSEHALKTKDAQRAIKRSAAAKKGVRARRTRRAK